MKITKLDKKAKINWKKNDGLIPVIAQDYVTGKVLMLGYMNKSALDKTLKTELLTFFSRTKKKLWTKGETSGNLLKLKSLSLDCDGDTLLAKVLPVGPVCHLGTDTCWGEVNAEEKNFLYELELVINSRKTTNKEGSYTHKLFKRGINKIAQKVGEEAVELVIEAKDNNAELYKEEAADLMYHLLVLGAAKEIPFSEIVDVLKKRHQ